MILDRAQDAAIIALNTAQPALLMFEMIPVGSRAINGHGADFDFCVLATLPEGVSLHEVVLPVGWEAGGSANADDRWESWKATVDGEVLNVLLTAEKQIFETWRASTEVGKIVRAFLGRPLTKRERVALHRIIQEDCSASNAIPTDIPEDAP